MRTQISHPVVGPDILRSPELHDFSDLPRMPVVRNRMLVVALAIVAVLTVGHLLLNGTVDPEQSNPPRQTALVSDAIPREAYLTRCREGRA